MLWSLYPSPQIRSRASGPGVYRNVNVPITLSGAYSAKSSLAAAIWLSPRQSVNDQLSQLMVAPAIPPSSPPISTGTGTTMDCPSASAMSSMIPLMRPSVVLPFLRSNVRFSPLAAAIVVFYTVTVQRIVTAETPVYEGARIFQSDAYAVGGYLMQDRAVFYLLGFGTVLAITPILGLIKPLASLGQRTLPI